MFTFSDMLEIAIKAHAGQKDDNGIDYIHHPLYVYHKIKMKGGSNIRQMVAIGHDSPEDGSVTFEYLEERGCPEDVIVALKLMTHIRDQEWVDQRKIKILSINPLIKLGEANQQAKDEEYLRYVERLSRNDDARAVKIEDLRHNSDIRRYPPKFLENPYHILRLQKYAKALKILTGGKVGYA